MEPVCLCWYEHGGEIKRGELGPWLTLCRVIETAYKSGMVPAGSAGITLDRDWLERQIVGVTLG